MTVVAEYHNQSKLRFWCQMVLPLVYDDSLSYMELLNKVVTYLNNCIQDVGNCETNIESLLEAFVNLQDYVNDVVEDLSPLVEEKIDEMIESGEFGEILADALATVVSPEYDPTESYVPLNYVIKDGQLYCCTANTTGEWDSTKWRETTVGDELNTLMQKVYSLNAGDVSFDPTETYASGTVGNKLKNLTANDVEYNSSQTYNNATVGKELSNLNGAINSNPNIKLRSVTNSILTGSIWINEVFDHLVEYNDSPYGQIANALNILGKNVTHTMLSGAGLIYDGGNGNFYDYIVTNSINLSGYDYLMTMLWYNDMLSTPIGTPNDTASDNTLAGKVISVLSYLKTRYPSVKLILVGIPPVNGYIYGNDVFTGTYGNGYNIKQCDALMHTLAEKYNFVFIDFEQWFLSTYYQNFTDGTNVHSKSDKVYRVMGEYLATALSGQMAANSDYLKVIKLTSDNISGSFSGWRNMFSTDVPVIDETMTVVEIAPADPTQLITIVPAWKVVNGNVQLYANLKDTGTTFNITLARTNKTGNNGVFHVPRFVQRSLVTTTTIGTSGAVTVNNYNSRKFSDYTMVALLLGEDGADISCCMTLPVSRFTTNNCKLRMSGLGGANLDTPSGAIITYVSDTSCTVELTGSKQFNKLQILGITVE